MKKPACARCGQEGHRPRDCQERRLAKLWPGQHVFRGAIRLPEGNTITMEMPLGKDGERILAELLRIMNPPS